MTYQNLKVTLFLSLFFLSSKNEQIIITFEVDCKNYLQKRKKESRIKSGSSLIVFLLPLPVLFVLLIFCLYCYSTSDREEE